MKFAWYPGCVSQGGCPELFTATLAIADRLGLELLHLKEAACTGAGVLSERNPELADTLNARTFAMAENLDLPIMTICSTCQGVMSAANAKLTSDPDYLKKINQTLSEEGLEYKGTAKVTHLLWVIVEDLGLEKLKSVVKRPPDRCPHRPLLRMLHTPPYQRSRLPRPPGEGYLHRADHLDPGRDSGRLQW